MKKLTSTVEDEVYEGLHKVIGARRISRFLNDLARPHVTTRGLEEGYRAMAADGEHEREAQEWVENLTGDVADEPDGSDEFELVTPRRGEGVRVIVDPAIVGEIRKTSPAIVVSNDISNKGRVAAGRRSRSPRLVATASQAHHARSQLVVYRLGGAA